MDAMSVLQSSSAAIQLHLLQNPAQMGRAQLHLVPPAATIEACVAAVEQPNQRSNGREAANVAWALAMLEVSGGTLWHLQDAKAESRCLCSARWCPFPIA